MYDYIADYEIPVLEDAALSGDRDAARRLVSFYESEIGRMVTKRLRLEAVLAAPEPPMHVDADEVDAIESGR